MQTLDLVRDWVASTILIPAVLDGPSGDDLRGAPTRRSTRSSVMVETAHHVGQADFLRGLRERGTDTRSGWAGTA